MGRSASIVQSAENMIAGLPRGLDTSPQETVRPSMTAGNITDEAGLPAVTLFGS